MLGDRTTRASHALDGKGRLVRRALILGAGATERDAFPIAVVRTVHSKATRQEEISVRRSNKLLLLQRRPLFRIRQFRPCRLVTRQLPSRWRLGRRGLALALGIFAKRIELECQRTQWLKLALASHSETFLPERMVHRCPAIFGRPENLARRIIVRRAAGLGHDAPCNPTYPMQPVTRAHKLALAIAPLQNHPPL